MREVKTKAGASVKEWKPPTTQEKAAQNVCRSKKPDKSLRNREGRVALREMVMPELGLVPRDIPPAEDGDVLCEARIQHEYLKSVRRLEVADRLKAAIFCLREACFRGGSTPQA